MVSKSKIRDKTHKESKQKIFVGGLSLSVTKKDLYDYFKDYGKVVDTRVLYDGDQKTAHV